MTTGNRFVIDGVDFAEPEPEPAGDACHFLCGLCGATDDHVPSGEQWVGRLPADFDGGGVGVTDFLDLLAHWGMCP